MDLDWTGADFGVAQPGYHLVTVGEAKEGRSQKGDAYMMLRYDIEPLGRGPERLCFDVVMLQGKGTSIGLAKLQALGVKKGTRTVKPEELVGRRCWALVDFEEYKGKTSLKVKTTFQPFECGLWPESEPPEGAKSKGVADIADENSPF